MAFDKILVVDDSTIIRKTLENHLRKKQYSVNTAQTLADAERLLNRCKFDLVFVDVDLPDGDGTQLLERLSEEPGSPMIVVITGRGTIESAVNCMQLGAFDYLVKPCSIEEIDVILKKAESFSQLVKVNQYLSGQTGREAENLGNSPAIRHLRRLIKKVAATEATVLITGENGTGKELVAQELYSMSPLSDQPYIKVNCAAISESLIESEFFGHEKGSFTGAMQKREGRFELAHNGTILLDEIGEISPRLQVKLLRVLQEQEFERVGGNRAIRVNVRVLATTNRDLNRAVAHGEFREDLYYRLNVFPIHVPPLRERIDDVPILADYFLERYSRQHGISVLGFTKEAQRILKNHSWPGNVRELQNTIERAIILTETGKLIEPHALGLLQPSTLHEGRRISTVDHLGDSRIPDLGDAVLPFTGRNGDFHASENGVKSLNQLEKDHIIKVLEFTDGNRTQAASILKISTRTLRNKLNQYRGQGERVI